MDLRISDSARCQWRGESMDYSQAIEAMQFLQNEAALASRRPDSRAAGRLSA